MFSCPGFLCYTYTSQKATSGESSFVLRTVLAIIFPDDFLHRFKAVACPYENLVGFSMRKSGQMRDSQISHFTDPSITQTPNSVKRVVWDNL